ncbi:MAG: hypothetical protein ACTSWX_11095 [Promethearchaeota archaeon]
MEDLKSELNELQWLNYFAESCFLNPFSSNQNFSTLGYIPLIYPKISNNQYDVDFLLYHKNLKISLLVEVKGENGIEENHFQQLERYSSYSKLSIEKFLQNAEIEKPTVERIITCIAYRKDTLNNCLSSSSCITLLDRFKQDFLVLSMNPSNFILCENPEIIDWDDNLKNLLINGISLSFTPKRRIIMTEKPGIKMLIVGIMDFLIEKFSSGIKIPIYHFDKNEFIENMIHSTFSIEKLNNAILYFHLNKYCGYSNHKFVFNYEQVMNLFRERDKFIENLIVTIYPNKKLDRFVNLA